MNRHLVTMCGALLSGTSSMLSAHASPDLERQSLAWISPDGRVSDADAIGGTGLGLARRDIRFASWQRPCSDGCGNAAHCTRFPGSRQNAGHSNGLAHGDPGFTTHFVSDALQNCQAIRLRKQRWRTAPTLRTP